MLDDLGKFNIENLDVGDVLKLYTTDKTQTLPSGGIVKMENQRILGIELVNESIAKVTVKDSLLQEIGSTSYLDIDGINALHKLISEIRVQME